MGKYEEIIYFILEKYRMPKELIYQCMIESGFVNNAVSSASAVGLWQFVRRTGDSYGLRYDGWVDERRDFIRATEAAARHMSDLYQRFKSYHLALAAYNAGIGSVSRAIKQTNSTDLFQIYRAGYLQGAGGIYVPKMLAAMIIAQDPALYGFKPIKKEKPFRFEIVEVPGGLDLALYAKYAKVSRSELENLNPSLRRGYVPPDAGGYPLRVPIRSKERLEGMLKKLELKGPQIFYEHRVRFGENLADIAYSYYISRRTLKQVNRLKSNQLEVASVLLIPKRTSKKTREILTDTLLVAINPEVEFNYPNRQLVYFPIRRSLSIERLASFFKVSPGEVTIWNSLDPDARLQRGMAIRLYISEDFDPSTALLARPDQVQLVNPYTSQGNDILEYARSRKERRIKKVKHKVRSGQTLKRIAK
jgi:membrane-bound lytic murein transglycosylase D